MNEQELLKELQELSRALQQHYGYSTEEVLDKLRDDKTIPATVFSTNLSPLQAIVTYLKDEAHHDFNNIAKELKRSYRAVWGAYQHTGIIIEPTTHTIPLAAIDEEKSILESVVTYLKEHDQLSLAAIGRLLHKDARTIWTVWHRAQLKKQHATAS